jgi:DNA-3-methyladenine glycosylase II
VLAEVDPVVARLVSVAGPPRIVRSSESHFAALLRSVVFQQLAGAAATAIYRRLVAALGDVVTPAALLELSDEGLRSAGVSRNKSATLRDLAAKVLDGTVVLDPRSIARASDDEIVARLSEVRGVGRWTSQMFLMVQLRRIDVWPAGDLGVRRGYGLAWQVATPTERHLEALGDRFRPYRSVAAWYCWRACEIYASAPVRASARVARASKDVDADEAPRHVEGGTTRA